MNQFTEKPLPMGDSIDVAPTVEWISIDRIHPYDRNPRRQRNPRYDEIRASLLARGFVGTLNVTQRPDETDYTVDAGGNTCLVILQEFWQETRDTRFAKLPCCVNPWVSESQVLIAHLIENDQRGAITLADRAMAIQDLRKQLSQEFGKGLTDEAFLKRLTTLGYQGLSQRQLKRLEFVATELDALIPKALASGLGSEAVDAIRGCRDAYRRYCQRFSNIAFDMLYYETMMTHDGEAFDFAAVRRKFDAAIAEKTGQPINRVRLEVDAELYQSASTERDDNGSNPLTKDSPVQLGAEHDENRADETDAQSQPEVALDSVQETPAQPHPSVPELTIQAEQEPKQAESKRTERPVDQRVMRDDYLSHLDATFDDERLRAVAFSNNLKSLRSRAYVIAHRFAQRLGFADLVLQVNKGYGFLVEKPAQPVSECNYRWAWWTLVSLSEELVTEVRMTLFQDLNIARCFLESDDDEFTEQIGALPDYPAFYSDFLLASDALDDKGFRDLALLVETCRLARSNFPESSLWTCQTIEQIQMRSLLHQLKQSETEKAVP